MRTPSIVVVVALAAIACTAQAGPRERVVGGSCPDCKEVYAGRPRKLGWDARIAGPKEPGEPFVLEGTVRDAAGAPAAGIIVYAYHTDAQGEYPPHPSHAHGRLRGFARTDASGRYRFTTIRPARYPQSRAPQHIHMHVVEPGRCTYVIDEVLFTDDPMLPPPEDRGPIASGRGGPAVVTPLRTDPAGAWRARRDITLGAGIPDYDRCGVR